jgi:HD-like signal output (HDOD) protein/CheY-like chemotaxis protein
VKGVLFVDDEPHLLSGLRRSLRSLQSDWRMAFVTSPEEALRMLAAEEFDVIVSDMRMPGVDGATLLTEVRTRYPGMARVVLSGQTEHRDAIRAVGIAHRFLAKPCEPEVLRRTLQGVCALSDQLRDPMLRAAVAGLDRLPSLPASYLALSEAARSPDVTARSFAGIIERDPAMSARVLQLVNSAFFGLPHAGIDLERAVGLLGVEIINSLLLSRAAFDAFGQAPGGIDMSSLWNESLIVARAARAIADAENATMPVRRAAYEAGLLHDVGHLVLAAAAPALFQSSHAAAAASGEPIHEAERRLIGCDHGVVGAYLLDLWGLPGWIVEAVAHHHTPRHAAESGTFSPLVAVHVASSMVPTAGAAEGTLDLEWLATTGLADRVPEWRDRVADACVEAAT